MSAETTTPGGQGSGPAGRFFIEVTSSIGIALDPYYAAEQTPYCS